MNRSITPQTVHGTIRVPGSRSITNRALIVAALSGGVSRIGSAGRCEDVDVLVEALRRLGIGIVADGKDLEVDARGGLLDGDAEVWAGESGTTARFLTTMAALRKGRTRIDGEQGLRLRPMGPLSDALGQLGARVVGDRLPLVVEGKVTTGGEVTVDASLSSQFVSALAMIGPALEGGLAVRWTKLASRPFVASTVEVMRHFGVQATLGEAELTVSGGQQYRAGDIEIPPDAASGVYPMVAAAITGGRVVLEGLRASHDQPDLEVARVLEAMGCQVQWLEDGVLVSGPDSLKPVDVDMEDAPDGALGIALAAAFARGRSEIGGLSTLPFKESDRASGLVEGINVLGATAEKDLGGIVVSGPVRQGGVLQSRGDHRMAMVWSIAGLAQAGVTIAGTECVAKTWPGFYQDMKAIAGPGWAVG